MQVRGCKLSTRSLGSIAFADLTWMSPMLVLFEQMLSPGSGHPAMNMPALLRLTATSLQHGASAANGTA